MDELTIGARLRTLRRWRGKTQVELAELADLSPARQNSCQGLDVSTTNDCTLASAAAARCGL